MVKRLAAEARSDAKRRVFQDEADGPSEEQRRDIMEMKARKYEAFKRGDFSGMTEKERMESVIDVCHFMLTRRGGADDSLSGNWTKMMRIGRSIVQTRMNLRKYQGESLVVVVEMM